MGNKKTGLFKIMHEQVGMQDGSPLKVKKCDYKHFFYPLHQHGEFELIYIIESTGTLYVGNKMMPFKPGTLVLLGSYLPHMFKSAPEYHEENMLRVKAVVCQFTLDFATSSLFMYPETQDINHLLNKSHNGISFLVSPHSKIVDVLLSLSQKKGAERLLSFVELLLLLSKCTEKEVLNTAFDESTISQLADNRLVTILGYLNRNYTSKISVASVAKMACMNESAFCRFFKEKTSKTLIEYVNELRVAYACKLLLDDSVSVAQAGYQSGFNNISGFNRTFKSSIRLTPTQYRTQYREIGMWTLHSQTALNTSEQ